MSSIAYLTNNEILDFHRICGNTKINFWLNQTTVNIKDFKEGDFIFFIGKNKKTNRGKEKGIIAYAKLVNKEHVEAINLWSQYGQLNGYNDQKQLDKAFRKHKIEPNQELVCFNLKDLIFFIEPIYLSDFDVEIPIKTSRYFYLNNKKENIVNQIIRKAQNNGLDLWNSILYNEQNDETIELNEVEAMLNEFLNDYSHYECSQYDKQKIVNIIKSYYKNHDDYNYLKNSNLVLYKYYQANLDVILPMMTAKKKDNRYKIVIGYAYLLKKYMEDKFIYPINVKVMGIDVNGQTHKLLEEV